MADHRRNAAFSLVEMLVVIGVIALIIAILLPVLSMARLTARMSACQTNLSMLGKASLSYAIDNDGEFLKSPGNGLSIQTVESPTTGPKFRESWSGYLSNYSVEEGSESMYCPFFEGDEYHSWPKGWNKYNTPERFGPGYYWMGYANFAHRGNNSSVNRWRSEVEGPTLVDGTPPDMPLFGDIIEGPLDGNLDDWIHFSHTEGPVLSGGGLTSTTEGDDIVGPNGFNSVYVDGSVEWTDYSPNLPELEVSYSAQRNDRRGFIWDYNSRPE